MDVILLARNLSYQFCACLIACLILSPALAAQPKHVNICTQEYALCTSAPCIPDPRHPGYAICSCVVKQGDSAGYQSCQQRAPKQYADKTSLIISTFSFAQFDEKKAMSCSKGQPWTDCVDSPCVVNPMDPSKAICSCPIKHEQVYFTFGGDCDTKTCVTGFWSGSTDASGIELRNAMLKKLNITKNPWPNSACSTTGHSE